MPIQHENLIYSFEGHDIEGIQTALSAGADPCSLVQGKLPIVWLLEDYTRSDRFGDCLRLLLDRGAVLPDPVIEPILFNDADRIRDAVNKSPTFLNHRVSLRSAFTSLDGVSLLHVAAEYGNLEAARALIEAGADVNARADLYQDGLNGHTPIFHTVNSNGNRSEPVMRLLLEAGAKVDIRLRGIAWGKGFDWETIFFDVTPISYAQAGLMPQVHRKEADVYANIQRMVEASGETMPELANVPNKYLLPRPSA